MVRELQVIFGLDAVAGELRIARHALVLLEQLGGIAALPIVLAITAATTPAFPVDAVHRGHDDGRLDDY